MMIIARLDLGDGKLPNLAFKIIIFWGATKRFDCSEVIASVL